MGEAEEKLKAIERELGIDPKDAGKGVPTLRLLSIQQLIDRSKSAFESIKHLRADVRPLSLLSPVVVGKSNLTGERLSHGGVRYFFPNNDAVWNVVYHNKMSIPQIFDYMQEVDGTADEKKRNRLEGGEDLSVITRFRVAGPARITAKAECGLFGLPFDSVSKNFDIGVLRYGERPVVEFPGGGACGTDWTEWVSTSVGGEGNIYRWGNIDTVRNARRIGDIYYRFPGESMTITRETRVTNTSGRTADFISITGLILANVFADGNRWCFVHNFERKIWKEVESNGTRTSTRTIAVPNWMYGRIVIWNYVYIKVNPYGLGWFHERKEYNVGDMVPP